MGRRRTVPVHADHSASISCRQCGQADAPATTGASHAGQRRPSTPSVTAVVRDALAGATVAVVGVFLTVAVVLDPLGIDSMTVGALVGPVDAFVRSHRRARSRGDGARATSE